LFWLWELMLEIERRADDLRCVMEEIVGKSERRF